MHGAGIVSIGFVMDAIADRYRAAGVPTSSSSDDDLEPLREVCRWTDGYWDFGPGDPAQVERDPEHVPGHPDARQLPARPVQGQGLEPIASRVTTMGSWALSNRPEEETGARRTLAVGGFTGAVECYVLDAATFGS